MGGDYRCSLIIYHPSKYPECLILEPRRQQSSGSTENKLYLLRDNIKKYPKHKAIIIIAGEGQSDKAKKFLKNSVGDNLDVLFSMDELQIWINEGGL